MALRTPYYLIDERRLLANLKIVKQIKDSCGVKSVLALKCFSGWAVFGLMKKYLDGTTSSSLYEARLGREEFGKEVHAYSVAFSKNEIKQAARYADKVIFNSISQLKAFHRYVKGASLGLRVNPGVSFSHFDLADPARRFSRLGVADKDQVFAAQGLINGLMFHFNCENDSFSNFSSNLEFISRTYGSLLKKLEWASLGGGIYFTKKGYPRDKFCKKLKAFGDKFRVQVYLEPGEAVITNSAELITEVLDVVHNEIDIAVVDSSTEAHMLDLLIYGTSAKIEKSGKGKYKYMVAGRSCLAGDVFGVFKFKSPLKRGSIIKIADAAGYTMVKKNWFNGLNMPSIAVKRINGKIDVVRTFKYKDFKDSLS